MMRPRDAPRSPMGVALRWVYGGTTRVEARNSNRRHASWCTTWPPLGTSKRPRC